MRKGFDRGQTPIHILTHELLDEILAAVADVRPDLALEGPNALHNTRNDLILSCPIERRSTTEHDIKDDTNAPHVTLFVVGADEDLRRDVVRCAVHLVHHVRVRIVVVRGAEVNDFDSAAILDVQQDILRFEVSVSNVLTVAVGNGLQDLLANVCSLILRQVFAFADLIKQLAAFAQLCDEEYGAPILVYLIKTHNVWVGQIFEDVNFVHEASLFRFVKLQLVDHFDSAHLAVCLVSSLFDLAKGARSENFVAHGIVLGERLHIVVLHHKILLRSVNIVLGPDYLLGTIVEGHEFFFCVLCLRCLI